jgi:hypothetical protein
VIIEMTFRLMGTPFSGRARQVTDIVRMSWGLIDKISLAAGDTGRSSAGWGCAMQDHPAFQEDLSDVLEAGGYERRLLFFDGQPP